MHKILNKKLFDIGGKTISVLAALAMLSVCSISGYAIWQVFFNKTQTLNVSSTAEVTFSSDFNAPIAVDTTSAEVMTPKEISVTTTGAEQPLNVVCTLTSTDIEDSCTAYETDVTIACYRTDNGAGKVAMSCASGIVYAKSGQTNKVFVEVTAKKASCPQTSVVDCTLQP